MLLNIHPPFSRRRSGITLQVLTLIDREYKKLWNKKEVVNNENENKLPMTKKQKKSNWILKQEEKPNPRK